MHLVNIQNLTAQCQLLTRYFKCTIKCILNAILLAYNKSLKHNVDLINYGVDSIRLNMLRYYSIYIQMSEICYPDGPQYRRQQREAIEVHDLPPLFQDKFF